MTNTFVGEGNPKPKKCKKGAVRKTGNCVSKRSGGKKHPKSHKARDKKHTKTKKAKNHKKHVKADRRAGK